MTADFWEVHEGEYEALTALFSEEEEMEENLRLMDADWFLSGGNLWG